MFFVNNEIDEKYFMLKKNKIASLKKQMSNIGTRAGLESYIRSCPESISNLLIVLGVSTETFKRVISMFRIERGMIFSSEWDANQLRRFILDDKDMMAKVCNLFLVGIGDSDLKSKIPGFRLCKFTIDNTVLQRLNNDDFLDFLVSKDFDTQYNSDVSQSNIGRVDEILTRLNIDYNIEIIRNQNVDPVGNGTRDIQVNYMVGRNALNLPKFYIKYSFNTTTSRGQTDFKRSVKDLRDYIKNKNPEAKQIVIIDGAGWVGRQSDLKDVWDYSHYCLNLNNIETLKELLKQ